jgi:hypothetical protein
VDFTYTQHQAPQMYDAKVAWPVRIGFTTAVPVGAKVKVQVSIRNYDAGAVEVAELKSVTIGEHTYELRTDSIESPPSAATEVTFTTVSELRVNR